MENTLTASLLDTNILVYANNADSPFHAPCRALVEKAIAGDIDAVIAVQNLVELYAVITDKRRVERPLSSDDGRKLIEFYATLDTLRIISPSVNSLSILTQLIAEQKPQAQHIFDFMLVATMMENNVSGIYTYNADHFKPFKNLSVSHP
jgi:predicted nucleic acid-binding protein